MRKNDFCIGVRFRAVGVDAHIDPQENARFMVVFRQIGFDFPFYTVGADDSVRPRKRAVLRKSDAHPQYFNGPMRRPQASFEAQPRNARLLAPRWASAPTTDNARFHDFEGGQSRPPLQRVLKITRVRRKNAVIPIPRRGFYFPTQKRSKILFVISSRMVRPVTSPRADMAASTSTSTASGVMPCRMDSSAASSAFPARRTASA